jgi:hypothetical protein
MLLDLANPEGWLFAEVEHMNLFRTITGKNNSGRL